MDGWIDVLAYGTYVPEFRGTFYVSLKIYSARNISPIEMNVGFCKWMKSEEKLLISYL